ncbi:hypothetical protein [Aliiruegeria sabulilitoris]|uniref:hypothetical protein n=1 Tax=Aliiruegeria sabulilitoris TaxID=1510458 RepID=UPI00082AE238|nr:hypothetical protein [Aliiruegeria sabulilitoris]NDR55049.1 hypothetical protein [Pseudoruegeria sp. M32A2M]
MDRSQTHGGQIVAHRNDRMGGRLISILNAIRISRDYDIPFVVAWVSHGRTAEELRNPTDIFTPEYVSRHFIDGDMSAADWAALDDLDATHLGSAESLKAAATEGKGFLSQRSVGTTVLPWEDAEAVAERLAGCFDGIGFCDTIRRVSEQIDARLAGTHLSAYHIRRGDIISNPITSQKLWPNKYIPREFYEVHLTHQLEDPEAACLVFSDTRHEVERLKVAGGDRVMTFEELVGDEELLLGQRDFLELFAMSRCKQIFGPPHSAFSQTAATLGGGTVFSVQDALSSEGQAEAMELLISRMDAPEEHFLGDGDLGQCFPFLVDYLRGQGRAAQARDLLAAQVNRGFRKPYVFPLLSELCVDCGDLSSSRKVHKAAWGRPVTGDDALGNVASYAALAHLEAGEAQEAHRWAHVAWWMGPMDRLVPGVLGALLSAGWLNRAPSYPIDPRMISRKGSLFPGADERLSKLNDYAPPEGWMDAGTVSYPWEVALRDWRLVHGKRVGRGYWNHTRIRNGLVRLEKNHARLAGSPELESAAAVMLRELGQADEALARNRAALRAYPDEPIYLKREADILLEDGKLAAGLVRLEEATEAAERHPCYLAALGHWYGRAKRPEEMAQVYAEIATVEHDLIELQLMTAEVLRRREATREQALAQITRAVQLGHGAQRLQTAQARILAEMGQLERSAAIFRELARSGVAQATTFAHMYRLFDKAGELPVAEAVIAESPFPVAEIRELVEG